MADLSSNETGMHAKSNRPSPVLLVFLLLPVLGLIAAAVMLASANAANAPSVVSIPTPNAVTLPAIPSPAPVVGAPVLDFELQDLDGETVKLSDYAGRVIFLNFWQTTCEPCKRELPALQAFAAEQAADGPAVLAVNIAEPADTVRAFLESYGVSDLTIPLDTNADAADMYGVFQIPVTFVIDTNGNVRYPHYGEITREDMLGYLQAVQGAA